MSGCFGDLELVRACIYRIARIESKNGGRERKLLTKPTEPAADPAA